MMMNPNIDEVRFLVDLVSIYSPTLKEKEAVEFCTKQMAAMGYRSYIDPAGNAVGVLGDGPAEIMLIGHVDTVKGFIEVKQAGDILWGRGAVDAKGPLASFIIAAASLGARPGWKITVIGAVGGRRRFTRRPLPGRSPSPRSRHHR